MIYEVTKGLTKLKGFVTRILFFGGSKIYAYDEGLTLTIPKTKQIEEQIKGQKTIELAMTWEELCLILKEHMKNLEELK